MAIKMEHKPMTRGDEIRAMDDKALARFIIQIEVGAFHFCNPRPDCRGDGDDPCEQCLEQWLGREACPAEEPGGEPNG